MEKNTTAVLKDFSERIDSLGRQLAALKEELASLEAALSGEKPAVQPDAVDIDIDVLDIPETAVPEPPAVEAGIPLPDLPVVDADIPLPEDLPAEEPVEADLPEDEPVVADLPEDIPEEPAPAVAAEPVAETPVAEAPAAEPAPAEEMTAAEPAPAEEEDMPLFAEETPAPVPAKGKRAKGADGSYAWMTARPGMPVKNLRSAISLFDRALFINTLFKEDYALYDKTIGELNTLSTLDEAVDYVAERFPDWNLGSDVVYSFMMAIRKKLG